MNLSRNLARHMVTGIFSAAGIFGFMADEFIISSALFCMAFISSNLDFDGSFRA